jgi:protein-S-isoprenylcysteine O-methyltransferase Ste14
MMILKILYWAGLAAQIVIRSPYQKTWKAALKIDQRVSRTEQVLLGLLSVAGILLPLVYTFTSWLAFADYNPPDAVGWLGAAGLAAGLYLFYRAHTDLKANWSPSLQIFEGHALVTSGVYARIRHPMYAAGILLAFAQLLLLQNWLVGPSQLILFVFFYLLRVGPEEKMMLDTFGDAYRAYCAKTGGLFPKF